MCLFTIFFVELLEINGVPEWLGVVSPPDLNAFRNTIVDELYAYQCKIICLIVNLQACEILFYCSD